MSTQVFPKRRNMFCNDPLVEDAIEDSCTTARARIEPGVLLLGAPVRKSLIGLEQQSSRHSGQWDGQTARAQALPRRRLRPACCSDRVAQLTQTDVDSISE